VFLTRVLNCSIRSGTRKKNPREIKPSMATTVNKIASPRGIKCESARTGKESTIASATPPRATAGTVGAAYKSSAKRAMPTTTMPIQTRVETRIGVRYPPDAEFFCRSLPRGLRARSLAHLSILIVSGSLRVRGYERHSTRKDSISAGKLSAVSFQLFGWLLKADS
jgi:hypothetical protein